MVSVWAIVRGLYGDVERVVCQCYVYQRTLRVALVLYGSWFYQVRGSSHTPVYILDTAIASGTCRVYMGVEYYEHYP